jgi:hypothetical protein
MLPVFLVQRLVLVAVREMLVCLADGPERTMKA